LTSNGIDARALRETPRNVRSRRSVPARRRRGLLLIVDDDPLVRQVSRRLLECQWEVETAAGADEAMDLLSGRSFDAVLSDFDMPGRDGLWLLSEIRRRYPRVARLMMSGGDPTRIEADSAPGVIQTFIRKPARRELLLDSLANAVPRRGDR
jgi:DNA-binding NtrC family response regulator